MSHHKGEHSAVFFEYDGVYPVINPDRETIRQNGPRFRPNGAPSYCLTVVDRHGIFHRGWIRKLHPQECFRLMGFSDEQFFKLKNELGLSDSNGNADREHKGKRHSDTDRRPSDGREI